MRFVWTHCAALQILWYSRWYIVYTIFLMHVYMVVYTEEKNHVCPLKWVHTKYTIYIICILWYYLYYYVYIKIIC